LGQTFSSTDIAKFLVDYINWFKIFFMHLNTYHGKLFPNYFSV